MPNSIATTIAVVTHLNRPGITECLADDRAARANRYELEVHRLEFVPPVKLIFQASEALLLGDQRSPGFDAKFHTAHNHRDAKALGELLLRALDLHRHHVAEKASANPTV